MRLQIFHNFTLVSLLVLLSSTVMTQTTAFTYQGKLTDAGSPATGAFDLTFRLFDLQSGGSQIGTVQTKDDVPVTAGIFTVNLDFGSPPFTSTSANYLEISVRPGASTGAYTTLTPRQALTSSPYAIQTLRAESAAVADDATHLGGLPANQFTQNNDPRLSDDRNPTAGSGNYIQNNPPSQQASSSFNVSGNGTVGGTLSAATIDAGTQFNIGTNRVLSTVGFNNIFVGVGAGRTTVPAGIDNSFFGKDSGSATTGSLNSFFGYATGTANVNGTGNAFFGFTAGSANTSGDSNTFIGANAGNANLSGGNNTIVGNNANTSVSNLNFGSAIGSGAVVSTSDTVVIGKASGTYVGTFRPADAVQIPGNLYVSGTLNATLPAGSINYIQNQGAGPQSASFNISGNGIVGTGLVVRDPGTLRVLGASGGNERFNVASNGKISVNLASGTATDGLFTVNGTIQVEQLGSNGSSPLCHNTFRLLSTCSQSFVDTSSDQTIGGIKTFSGSVGLNAASPNFRLHVKADGQDGIKIQHTGTGQYPQIRWTDQDDNFKASIGVGPTGSEGFRFFVNGSDRLVIEPNGLLRIPGGIIISNPNTVVITSANGACWGITVSNTGVLGTFSTPCP